MSTLALFALVSLATFAATRMLVFLMPNRTVTGYLRHKTLLYVHHIFVGVVVLAVFVPLLVAYGAQPLLVSGAAFGTALCLDELTAWLLFSSYPARKEFSITLLLFAALAAYLQYLAG
jgi:predicted ABC-type exoprotein transport system permease subunit